MHQSVLRPLHLIRGENVSLEETTDLNAPVASVSFIKNENKYTIRINHPKARTLYTASMLNGKVSYNEFVVGLLYHEVFHILFKSFDVLSPIPTEFFKFVHNVLLDAQIEYQGTLKYPSVSTYLRWILSALRRDTDMVQIESMKGGSTLVQMKDDFFYLVRFGVVTPHMDPHFRDFLIPLILSAVRLDVSNVMLVTRAVYEYFMTTAESQELVTAMSRLAPGSFRPLNAGDLEVIGEAEQVLSSNLKDVLDEVQNTPDTGKMPGSELRDISVEEKDTAFYRSTVAKYAETITLIRNAFKRKLNAVGPCPTFDGDMNLARQQQAYVNSLTGDSDRDYLVMKPVDLSVDVVVIRDISGSTAGIQKEYAEMTVCLLASVQQLRGVRSADIDFSTTAVALLDFDKSIREARLFPRADGGTNLAPAYQLALNMRWQSKRRIIHVITDGGFGDSYKDDEAKLLARGVKIFKWLLLEPNEMGGSYSNGLRKTSVSTFGVDIAKSILGEL